MQPLTRQLLIAIAVVLIIIFGIYLWRKNRQGPKYTAQPAAAVWDPSAPGAYACPSGYTTATPGYCVLPASQAPAACTADPKCLGYLKPGSQSPWPPTMKGDVQLVSATPTADGLWPGTVYYTKPTAA